jgi:ribosomal protein S1
MTRGSSSSWSAFVDAYATGDVVSVVVTKALPFGALVEAGDGVPGLLRGVTDVRVGQRVAGRIDAIDDEKQRVGLIAV